MKLPILIAAGAAAWYLAAKKRKADAAPAEKHPFPTSESHGAAAGGDGTQRTTATQPSGGAADPELGKGAPA